MSRLSHAFRWSQANLRVSRPRVAFVVQRCGNEVRGGAERLCLETAARMARHWDPVILTTCARDSRTWANVYDPGPCRIENVPALRFPVDRPRRPGGFDALSRAIADRLPSSPEVERAWVEAQGPVSSALARHLVEAGASYDAVYFYTYVYATTYFLLPLVEQTAVLVALAHDEWPLRMGLWDEFFRRPQAIVCVTPDERRLLERRLGVLPNFAPIIATGIDAPPPSDPERFRRLYGAGSQFLLYVGRVDEAKGCRQLVDDYLDLPRAVRERHKLVLLGPITMPLRKDPTVIVTGQVSESTKWDALGACAAVVVPSQYESLSIAALEAWSAGKPVIASGLSPVLVGQCRRSGGGVWYANRREFQALVASGLLGKGAPLGAQGEAYVRREYRWDRVEAQHLQLVANFSESVTSRTEQASGAR